ncbi:MAG TPA: HAD family hydrolase [Desulfobulbaceae bacterium]|nr:HAD family hydrolase [Desulfobulbaceae bacterium]
MQHKAVIFDLDGTLLDTLDDLAASGNRVLAAAGMPVHPEDRYRFFVGDGLQVLIERIVPPDRRDPEQLAALVEAFREDYGRNWDVHTRLYEGVAFLLSALQEEGLAINVLSNKPDDFTRLCVSRYLHAWSFREILGQRPGMARKPDPAGALYIADKLGLPPSAFLYLGDTGTDMQTAVSAGMHAVGALWGFRTAEELLASGAADLAGQPLDVLRLMQRG